MNRLGMTDDEVDKWLDKIKEECDLEKKACLDYLKTHEDSSYNAFLAGIDWAKNNLNKVNN